jgi:oligoendopeptidase F
MPATIPTNHEEALSWSWDIFEPHYQELLDADLTAETLDSWLQKLTALSDSVSELDSRLYVATSVKTADQAAEDRLLHFARTITEPQKAMEHKLQMKLLESGLTRPDIAEPIKQIKADAELFREANLPRETALVELATEYDKLCGARSVAWNGEDVALSALDPALESADRSERESAYRLIQSRILEDRQALNGLWTKMRGIRQEIAREAGKPSFIDYQYQKLSRFDYTPAEAQTFRDAILEKVVPAATKVYQRRAERLGLTSLKPWDVDAPAYGSEPLKPYQTGEELISKSAAIFASLDPQFEEWFMTMDKEGLMDLFGRKNKANGGYCTTFSKSRHAYIFMNATGTHDNLQTLLHEAGHCFHAYECFKLPYSIQRMVGSEFCEVASMGMEMLAQPYLTEFYSEADAARAQIQHLEKCLLFWPYMAVVDGFQHWAYQSEDGGNPEACDQEWKRLWRSFMPGIDYAGLEDTETTGWHRKLHIFQVPFYYIEYGLAQVGAMQVWANARKDEAEAVRLYREGLRLGCTVSLPQLFQAAGGRFALDGSTLGALVEAADQRLEELLPLAAG